MGNRGVRMAHGRSSRAKRTVSIASGISTLLETNAPPLGTSGTYKVRVRFAGFANENEFFYLTKKDLQAPATEFAVLDPNQQITPFLKTHGMHFREFSGTENLPVIVAADSSRDAETLRRFTLLMDYVKRGGVAVFLKLLASGWAPRIRIMRCSHAGVFPFQTRLRAARGDWAPVNHGVRPHPIFEGLPAKDFMGQAYLNVCATETIEGIQAPPIVGSLSFVAGNGVRHDWNYHGPQDAWWGSDMVVAPYGEGRMLLSTLRITENLGHDPVADKLFYNIVRWTGSSK